MVYCSNVPRSTGLTLTRTRTLALALTSCITAPAGHFPRFTGATGSCIEHSNCTHYEINWCIVLIAPGLHVGYTWATPELHLGCTWATPGLHLAYTWAAPELHLVNHSYCQVELVSQDLIFEMVMDAICCSFSIDSGWWSSDYCISRAQLGAMKHHFRWKQPARQR